METIDWMALHNQGPKGKDAFAEWALVHAIGVLVGKDADDFCKNMDSHKLQVEFTINGKQFSFLEVMQELNRQHDRMLKEQALELIEEKFASIRETVDAADGLIKDAIRQARVKLDLPEEREW